MSIYTEPVFGRKDDFKHVQQFIKKKTKTMYFDWYSAFAGCSVLIVTVLIVWQRLYPHIVHLERKPITTGYIAPTLFESIRQDGFFDFDGAKLVDPEETREVVHIVYYQEMSTKNQVCFLFKQEVSGKLQLLSKIDYSSFDTETQRFCYYWLAKKLKCTFELLVKEDDIFGLGMSVGLQVVTLEQLASKSFVEQHFEDPITKQLLQRVLDYNHILM